MAAHAKDLGRKSYLTHRKRRTGSGSAATARTAVTIAVAGAVSATGMTESGTAAPRPTPDQVRQQVDQLFQQAEAATQRYDGAKDRAEQAGRRLDGLQDRLARSTRQLNTARDRLGWLAAERYRTGGEDPTLRLILTSSPGQYLERSEMLERANAIEAASLTRLSVQQAAQSRARDSAAGQFAALESARHDLDRERQDVEGRLKAAKSLLASVSAAQRRKIEAGDPAPAGAGPLAPGPVPLAAPAGGDAPAPGARAARAVAFAYAQIGKPYVWGATGPSAYDCSGLTRAAWAAAGVSLPRTTYSQINAGTRVPESRLRPGDLVFYYAGVSHVAIYAGGGRIIHAPHPGAAVRLAPVDEMPFVGAVRPA